MSDHHAEPVMQPRCIFCKCEHYAIGVMHISFGKGRCHRCGRVPPVFYTYTDYATALLAPAGTVELFLASLGESLETESTGEGT